jgi:hypothetical protein
VHEQTGGAMVMRTLAVVERKDTGQRWDVSVVRLP